MRLFNLLSLDFAAKVRWRMKCQRDPLFVILQDKYKVRDYAASKGVKTADLLYVTEHPEDIPFAKLPDRYMIKANHGCGWNILCYDSRFYLFGDGKYLANEDGSFVNETVPSEDELTQAAVVENCKNWLSAKYIEAEWAYQHIPPKIIIENLLVAENNKILVEYKLYTFNGIPKAIIVNSPIFKQRGQHGVFATHWNEIQLTKYNKARLNPLPEKPARLSQIIDAARKLGEDIDFARIDLYDSSEGVILGEMTFYPNGTNSPSPTACPVFNKWLGDQWTLSAADRRKAILLNIGFSLMKFPKNTIRRIRYKLRN
ncbi:MAG: ATP-grasp fold amidoligase family protein [Abditibacteriaceae bacterium]